MDYDKIREIVRKQFSDDFEKQKPKTAADLKNEQLNPMKRDKKPDVYNAFYCYDENNKICGYNLQLRIEEDEVYKHRIYLPLVDDLWRGVKKREDLPDKKVKIGYDGEYQSQNALLEQNDIQLATAMIINFNIRWFVYLGNGYLGLREPDDLYMLLCRFKYTGYPINDATKKMNETKIFV
ncbi:MAG: hypothetical protein K6C94_00850 [Candidatus Gastranaerophilales bacterium]|nr:hypothetical protein [Candidatus Gastranaerophilales bacterium]